MLYGLSAYILSCLILKLKINVYVTKIAHIFSVYRHYRELLTDLSGQ